MSESDVSQTHEGPVPEVPGGASSPAVPPRPSRDPIEEAADRGHPSGAPGARGRPGRPSLRRSRPGHPRGPQSTRPSRRGHGSGGPGPNGRPGRSRGQWRRGRCPGGRRSRSRRRSGRERTKGKQVGRYLVCVHVAPGMTQIAMLEGRSLVEHYVSRAADDATQIDGNIYRGRVQNVLPGMEAAFVDIGTPKNAVLYRGDVRYDRDDVEGGRASAAQPRIEQVLKAGPDHPVPGDQEPDRGQGRPADPGGLPARALRRAGPQQRRLRHLQAPRRRRAPPPAPDRRRGPAGRATA